MDFQQTQLADALAAFDVANAQDPHTEIVDGEPIAKELIYGQRMTKKLHSFLPDASPVLQLAARSQHICRWKIARSDYPMDRQGYKNGVWIWRHFTEKLLARF